MCYCPDAIKLPENKLIDNRFPEQQTDTEIDMTYILLLLYYIYIYIYNTIDILLLCLLWVNIV